MIHLLRKVFRRSDFAIRRLKIRKLSSAGEVLKNLHAMVKKSDASALREFHTQYIREISRADMTASFECVRLLTTLCKMFSPKKILDLGSGFSSYAFRQYALTDDSIRVWSVDDDVNWIEKTKEYLYRHNVNTEGLMILEAFIAQEENNFDLIFFDLNFVEVRKNYIKMVVEKCRPGGMIIFDDVHKPYFLYEVLRQTSNLPIKYYDIKPLTLDGFERYALLGIKNP